MLLMTDVSSVKQSNVRREKDKKMTSKIRIKIKLSRLFVENLLVATYPAPTAFTTNEVIKRIKSSTSPNYSSASIYKMIGNLVRAGKIELVSTKRMGNNPSARPTNFYKITSLCNKEAEEIEKHKNYWVPHTGGIVAQAVILALGEKNVAKNQFL